MKHYLKVLFLLSLTFTASRTVAQTLYDHGPIRDNSQRFVLSGTEWDCPVITYFFVNGTGDLAGSQEEYAVREAFKIWEESALLGFQEVFNENDADIRIGWEVGNHGDPCIPAAACAFDGINGVLAHAFFPPPNLNEFAGDIHFDDAENWTLSIRNSNAQPIDLITVAAHEIGHSLGLDHTTVSGSLMVANYTGSHRFLGSDDIAGIQALYGQKPTTNGPSVLCQNQQGTYSLSNVPAGMTVSWDKWSGLNVVSGQNTNSFRVQANSIDGEGWVQATLSPACGDGDIVLDKFYISQDKPVWDPYIQLENGAEGESWYFCTSHTGNKYTINAINNLNTHQVRIKNLSGTVLWTSITRTGKSGTVNYYPSPGWYEMEIKATNSCGTSNWIGSYVEYKDCSIGGGGGGGEFEEFAVYPNPVEGNSITIARVNREKETHGGQNLLMSVEIMDMTQKIIHRGIYEKGSPTIDTSSLKSGIYFLRIKRGASSEIKRIAIK